MKDYDFFENYVTIKSNQLINMMNEMMQEMSCKKCNVRHFKQWEAKMTSFKEEYHVFQGNLLNQINDIQDKRYAKEVEVFIEPICEKLEEHYEILANIYLSKRVEIEEKTTYFETCNCEPKDRFIKRLLNRLPNVKIVIQKRK